MKIIGLTGGIGSGKSYVAKIFNDFCFPVFYSDIEAKNLMSYDYKLKLALTQEFGSEIYGSDGLLNREFIANKIFNSEFPETSKKMNSILEPFLFSHFNNWCYAQKAWSNDNIKYCLFESAIIFESDLRSRFDAVINISAPLEIRMERVRKRDSFRSEEEIKSIISKQMPQEEKESRADFIIINDGIVPLYDQVNEVIKNISTL